MLLPVTDRALFTATGVRFIVISSTGRRHVLTTKRWSSEIPKNNGMGRIYWGAFSLPAGEYEFISWSFINTEGDAASKPQEKISFKLNRGDVLYLGNFNAIRVLGSSQFRDRFIQDMQEYLTLYRWMQGLNVKHEQMNETWWSLPGGKDPKVIKEIISN